MINYKFLDKSIQFYETKGFKRIEAPWTVTKAVSEITKPSEGKDYEIVGKDKVLVASGEQSFLYLILKGFLPPGKYQTITPCFRDEPFDIIHTKYFMKNELIVTENVNVENLNDVIKTAFDFFASFISKCCLDIVEKKEKDNSISFDIELNGIEIGSYGIRHCEFVSWIYGTGLAEPRFSTILFKK